MGKFTYQAWRYPGRTPELEHDSGGHESSYPRTRYSARLSHKDDPHRNLLSQDFSHNRQSCKCMTTLIGHDGLS